MGAELTAETRRIQQVLAVAFPLGIDAHVDSDSGRREDVGFRASLEVCARTCPGKCSGEMDKNRCSCEDSIERRHFGRSFDSKGRKVKPSLAKYHGVI